MDRRNFLKGLSVAAALSLGAKHADNKEVGRDDLPSDLVSAPLKKKKKPKSKSQQGCRWQLTMTNDRYTLPCFGSGEWPSYLGRDVRTVSVTLWNNEGVEMTIDGILMTGVSYGFPAHLGV